MGMKKTFEDTVTWIYNLSYLVGLSSNFQLRRNRKIPQTCNRNCFLKIQRVVRFLKTSESMSFSNAQKHANYLGIYTLTVLCSYGFGQVKLK